MVSPVNAAGAYASIAKIANGGNAASASSLAGANGAKGSSFGSMLEQAMSSMAQQGKETDGKIVQMAAGKADITDVVTAVAETEVAVETLVSVRDKVISAYEEIFRMPI
jgi:flagellar hook-basal body complex protein FliE